jgi:hypothetical protein
MCDEDTSNVDIVTSIMAAVKSLQSHPGAGYVLNRLLPMAWGLIGEEYKRLF